MNLLPKRFFDIANENGGGLNSEDVVTLPEGGANGGGADENKPGVAASIITDEELKSFNFNSQEELRNFLRKHKEESVTPEEKKAKDDLEKANFLKYAAENKLLNVDEYGSYENLKAKADRDLVFENYLTSYKEEHPEITDESELREAAEEDFNFEYKLGSSNEKTRQRAEAKLARDAKDLRTPIESKVIAAQEKYKTETGEYQSIKETYPKFEKFVDSAIAKNTPDKKVVTQVKVGDEDVNIEIELTQADRDAIAKTFKTPKTFQMFRQGKPEEIQASLDKKIDGWIFQNKKDAIISKTVEMARGLGAKEGSNVGANNPFSLKQGQGNAGTGEKTLEESNMETANRTQKYRR